MALTRASLLKRALTAGALLAFGELPQVAPAAAPLPSIGTQVGGAYAFPKNVLMWIPDSTHNVHIEHFHLDWRADLKPQRFSCPERDCTAVFHVRGIVTHGRVTCGTHGREMVHTWD